jgi:hypothetical protein
MGILELGCLTFWLGWPKLWPSYFMLPTITEMTGVHHAQLFSIETGVSQSFGTGVQKLWSSWSQSHTLEWQAHATVPNYWLKWGLTKCFPRLAWNHDPLDLSLPSGIVLFQIGKYSKTIYVSTCRGNLNPLINPYTMSLKNKEVTCLYEVNFRIQHYM